MSRPTIDATMMEIAVVMSKRGTCAKKQVGCVVTDEQGHMLSTGYNGQPRGHEHCTELVPCPAFLDANLSCQAIHAEMNALMRCPDVNRIHTVYVTELPCTKCMLLIKNTSARYVVYDPAPFTKKLAL